MQTIGRKRTKSDLRREQQRILLFPEVLKDQLWSNTLKGWCWTPRSMPLVLHAIRSLSKGSSAAETYFALWCHSLSESIVDMSNKASLIAAAGYTGATNERTWKERMMKLAELGFIKIASGNHGDISCVIILNPHIVLRKHKEQKTPGFDEKIYNCILENIASYGMADFNAPPSGAPMPPTLARIPVRRTLPPPPPVSRISTLESIVPSTPIKPTKQKSKRK